MSICFCYPSSLLNLKILKYENKNRKNIPNSNVCTISNERHQVKTYMDNSNGVRNASSNSYNKVRRIFVEIIHHH